MAKSSLTRREVLDDISHAQVEELDLLHAVLLSLKGLPPSDMNERIRELIEAIENPVCIDICDECGRHGATWNVGDMVICQDGLGCRYDQTP